MEHLSAEERACLMFLEETIESLEAEDDSGVSTDESDRLSRSTMNKTALLNNVSQTKPEGEYEGQKSQELTKKDFIILANKDQITISWWFT